MIMTIV